MSILNLVHFAYNLPCTFTKWIVWGTQRYEIQPRIYFSNIEFSYFLLLSSHKSMISSLLILRWKFPRISITFILTLDPGEDQTQIIRCNLYSSQQRSGQWAELSDVFEAVVEYHSGLGPARILLLFDLIAKTSNQIKPTVNTSYIRKRKDEAKKR